MADRTKEIMEVLRLFEESDFTTMQLELDGMQLALSKDGGSLPQFQRVQHMPPASAQVPVTASSRAQPATPAKGVNGNGAGAVQALAVSPTKTASKVAGEGLIAVKSPTPGTFYRAPSPGEPPFIEVGGKVSKNDTVCLIECMKLFNTIGAECDGTIASIEVENAQPVELGQVLVYIRPS